MADDTNWMFLKLRFGDDRYEIRVSPWAADQLAAGISVATLWSDHPDEIAVANDGTVIERHESDDPLQGEALPFVDPQ